MNTSPVRPISLDDRIKDNDPRSPGRVLTVTGFENVSGIPMVLCKTGARNVKVPLSRIYLDDKERRTGFSRVA
ncbi:hypothetical protein [Roseococcus pinisoli]|uniref:Uncharacterized protein n=1 Tax=Roseococcus pinisoli TaxID=2835040 RepID=A0ABS5QFN5_9PROT|nr:hypothetical protein [Roseococcus pinisoli]MBS7812308.1 hypothetical protein [Roseococcus pinisoli]